MLSEAEREAICRLATDIPAIWEAPTTTNTERKEILRQVIERVIVDVQGSSKQMRVRIEWIGGSHTEGIVIRPIGKLSELATYPQICQQVRELIEAGWAAVAIARALNEAGFRPPRSSTGFRTEMITHLQRKLGVKAPRPRVWHHEGFLPDEWWPTELTSQLHITRGTLLHWIGLGVVRARQLDEPLHRWVVWADEAEQERLRAYHQRAIGMSSVIAGRIGPLLYPLDEHIIPVCHQRRISW
jgi:hypothetical protein